MSHNGKKQARCEERVCAPPRRRLPGFDVFNVCTGKSITVLELAHLVRDAFHAASTIEHLPPREGDIRASACNPGKLRDALGFSARYSVEAGLGATVGWFRKLKSAA